MTSSKRSHRLLICGTGGHAKVVADAALSSGWEVLGFLDMDPSKAGGTQLGLPILAADEYQAVNICKERHARIVVAIGSNAVRKRVYETLCAGGLEVATIVHARAVVASSSPVGAGTVVFAGAIVNPDSRLGCNVIVNTAASIDHDNIIGDHAHVSPGAHLGGTVVVGEGTQVGVGATIRNNITIGAWSVIGAGAVVVKDVPERVVVFGVPAKVMHEA